MFHEFQGEVLVRSADRNAQYLAAQHLAGLHRALPAAISLNLLLAALFHDHIHTERPVVGQVEGVGGEVLVSGVPVGFLSVRAEVRVEVLQEGVRLHATLIVQYHRVAACLTDELEELNRRVAVKGELQAHLSDPFLLVEGLGNRHELIPRGGRLQPILVELSLVVVADLHVRPVGHEVELAVELAYRDQGGNHAGWDHLPVSGEVLHQPLVHQRSQRHIILGNQVNLHLAGLLHGLQLLGHVSGLHLERLDLHVVHLLEGREDIFLQHLPFRLAQSHDHLQRPGFARGGRLGTGATAGGEEHGRHESKDHEPTHP